jgi:hypothetical protein
MMATVEESKLSTAVSAAKRDDRGLVASEIGMSRVEEIESPKD